VTQRIRLSLLCFSLSYDSYVFLPAPIRERGEREVSKCEAAKSERSPFDVGLATVNVAVHEDSDVAQNERGSAGLVLAGASKGVLGAHVTLAVMT